MRLPARVCMCVRDFGPYCAVCSRVCSWPPWRVLRACWWVDAQSFFETVGDNPDLYGPLWINATLVFVIGVASNLSSWVATPKGQVG